MTEERPWGNFTVLLDHHNYKVKTITVYPKKRLSLQLHHQRSEHWFVTRGTGKVTLDNERIWVHANESIDIPVEAKHRIENTGDEDLVFVEIQTGLYFGEDDIERFEDDFGRCES
jgi:mannose-6-phosphate isomerase-like protein (cupin superfamily)